MSSEIQLWTLHQTPCLLLLLFQSIAFFVPFSTRQTHVNPTRVEDSSQSDSKLHWRRIGADGGESSAIACNTFRLRVVRVRRNPVSSTIPSPIFEKPHRLEVWGYTYEAHLRGLKALQAAEAAFVCIAPLF
jgi:hypothetical protein